MKIYGDNLDAIQQKAFEVEAVVNRFQAQRACRRRACRASRI